jgi:hypothetical protein
MKLPALTLHALARVHRLRPHYSAKFFKDDNSLRPVRGVTLWSTIDRAEATELWQKTLGETHGKGHVTLIVTLEVEQAESRAKVGHPARHRIGTAERQEPLRFFEAEVPAGTAAALEREGVIPVHRGVPAPVPGAAGDRPAAPDLQPDPPAGSRLAGTGEGVHRENLSHTTVDLTELVKSATPSPHPTRTSHETEQAQQQGAEDGAPERKSVSAQSQADEGQAGGKKRAVRQETEQRQPAVLKRPTL